MRRLSNDIVYPHIENWLRKNGWSAAKLARAIGLNRSGMSKILTGQRNMTGGEATLRLIEVTGLTTHELRERTDKNAKAKNDAKTGG